MARTQVQAALRQFRWSLQAEQLRRLSDAELLDCFVRDRNEPAFALLVERHGRLVWSACRQVLRHDEDAEDAYQAAFLVLVRRAASIRKGQTVACWLYRVASRIARDLAMDRVKRRRREAKVSRAQAAPATQEFAWQELQELLQKELAHLPEKYQAPFVLCCLDGKSKAEAARQLGWKEGTVSSRLAHARKRMQQGLARRGVALASVLCAAELLFRSQEARAGLARTAVKAASGLLAGEMIPGVVSPGVVALVEGMMKTMLFSKIKTTCLVLFGLGLAATGSAVLAWQPDARKVQPDQPDVAAFARPVFDEPGKALAEGPAAPAAQDVSPPWIGIASRETNCGPELFIQLEDGQVWTPRASADTVLLSYLPDYGLGGHECLSVDLADTNRTLLRFFLPSGAHVRKAELILSRSQSRHPFPSKPVTLAFHEVKEGWDEGKATWHCQPAFDRRPALTAQIDARAKEYRIDVTPLVRRVVEDGAANHGWLVRIHKPLAETGSKAGGPPAGWTCHGTEHYLFAVDDSVRHAGKQSCRIESRTPTPSDFAMLAQTIRADDYRGQRIRLSGFFKSHELTGMATLWMRIDSDNQLLGIDKSIEEAARGTSDWRQEHIVLDVPEDSKTIRFAVLVEGRGKAWVDDLRFEAVDRSIPLTNSSVRSGGERKPTMPKQPVNLDFGTKTP
jgi:RNA polymerase sigma factor (sigma-70 family)